MAWDLRANTGNGAYQLRLYVWEIGSSNAGNGSTSVRWQFGLIKVGSSGGYGSYQNGVPWHVDLDYASWGGTSNFSFGANDAIGTFRVLGEGTRTIGHDSNGTKTSPFGDAWIDTGTSIGDPKIGVQWIRMPDRRRNASAPRLNSASATSATTASVNFSASSDIGLGTESAYYHLDWSTDPTFNSLSNRRVSPGTHAINGLRPATKYYIRVTIRGRNGVWVIGQTREITTAQAAPNLTSLTINDPTSLRLTWTQPTLGVTITGYRVQLSTSSNFSSIVYDKTVSPTTAHVATGLVGGTRYYARVAVVSSLGQTWSNTRDMRLDQLPPAPTLLGVTPLVIGTSAAVSWQPPPAYDGSPVVRYEVSVSGDVRDVGLALSADVGGLTPGATYAWRVRAVSDFGASPWSNEITVTQPTLGVTAGAYYDGSSDGGVDATYAWTGTAGLSSSTATAPGVTAWVKDTGTDGVLYSARAYRYSGQRSAALLLKAPGRNIAIGAGGIAEIEPLADSTGSVWVRPTQEIVAAPRLDFLDATGTSVVGYSQGDAQTLPANQWTRLVLTAQAPVNAERVRIWIVGGPTRLSGRDPWPAGATVYVDAAMVTLGGGLYDYFDGDTADTIEYDHVWLGTPNASASWRQPTGEVIVPPDPLLDPDCGPFPTPPRPPIVDDSCATAVDRWRRTVVRVREAEVANWAPSLPTYVIRTTAEVRQMRILVYANPDQLDPRQLGELDLRSERIISYLPANTTLTIDVAMQRAYASVNGADPIPADHLLYGPDGGPASWEEMACGVEYVVALDVDAALPLGAVQPVEIWMTRMAR